MCVYQRWHTSLIVIAIVTWSTVLNSVVIEWLPRMKYLNSVCQIAEYIAIRTIYFPRRELAVQASHIEREELATGNSSDLSYRPAGNSSIQY